MSNLAFIKQILALLTQLATIIQATASVASNMLQILQAFIAANKGIALESSPYIIDTNVSTILLDVANGDSGLLAISDKQNQSLVALSDAVSFLSAKLDLLASQPVVLPSVPPSGYGGGGGSLTPSEIWNFTPLGSTRSVQDWMTAAGNFAYFQGFAQTRFQSAETGWLVAGQWWDQNSAEPNDRWIEPIDINTILPTDDTVAAWFQRVTGRVDYLIDDIGRVGVGQADTSFTWWLDVTQADFEILRGISGVGPSPTAITAPVWPGFDHVALGTSVALGDQLAIDDAMHGVIVTITGSPSEKPHYPYVELRGIRHIGALAFVSDHGEAEAVQPLSMTRQVYACHSMVIAAGVRIMCTTGLTGTVQPWARLE